MRTTIKLILLLTISAVANAQSPALMRQHFQLVAKNGHTYAMTEMVSHAADQNGFITLFEADGQRYIFSYNDNVMNKRTTIEVRNLDRNFFLRGWYVLPYAGTTAAEARAARARLTPSQFVVPFTIETNGFADTERIDRWHTGEGASHRSQLVQHVNGDLIRGLQGLSVAFESGSPAISTFCKYVETLVEPGQACRSNHEIAVIPANDDCAFDARFGYPCNH